MDGFNDRDREGKEHEYQDREEIYANAVRAGKRTYFFDVRATRGNDYYLTITESKRKYQDDGSFRYQKHKIFLYKEDFKKFSDALADTIKKIIELRNQQGDELVEQISSSFTDVDFEDLGTEQHNDGDGNNPEPDSENSNQ